MAVQGMMGLSGAAIVKKPTLLYASPQRLHGRWATLEGMGLDEGRIVAALVLSEKKWVARFRVTSTWPLIDSM